IGVEFSLPDSVADYGDIWRAGFFFAGQKSSAHKRLDAEHVKEAVRHINSANALWFGADFGQIQLRIPPASDRLKELCLLSPVVECNRGILRRRRVAAQLVFPDRDQPIRIAIWQRPQQHRIDHAEYCSVSADPKRKSQHRDDCETRLLD